MASPVVTYKTLTDELKLVLNDKTNQFMTDEEYLGYILKHVSNAIGSYNFRKRADKVWTYLTGGKRVWFYGGSFTGEDDCVYTYYANGTIVCTSGTPTATEYVVQATFVNFKEVVCDVCEVILMHKCKEPIQSSGDGSYTPPDETRIRNVMETWRGIVRL